MSLNRDRNFFPKKLGGRRLFAPFVPETGPFRRVSIMDLIDPERESPAVRREMERRAKTKAEIDAEADRRKQAILRGMYWEVDHTTWRPTQRAVARVILDGVEEFGLRYELNARAIADKIGRHRSSVYRQFANLRKAGWMTLYRPHYLDWKKTEDMRVALSMKVDDPEKIFCCAPAVHELNIAWSEATCATRFSGSYEGSSLSHIVPLSWKDSPDG